MTEYWKSNAMHYCEVCKVWMNDTKAARLNHERGLKHTELLAKKIRDMGKKQVSDKKEQDRAETEMAALEEAAKKQYEKDLEEAEALRGTWKKSEDTGYYYNELNRWYYDPKTKFYYGGEPATWTQKPDLPEVALFDYFHKKRQAAASSVPSTSGPASSSGARLIIKSSSEAAALPGAPKHPLSTIGGYQMPSDGKIGGAKGVGRAGADADTNKRKREDFAGLGGGRGRGRKLNPKEEEEQKKREAARARVAARTKTAFGLA